MTEMAQILLTADETPSLTYDLKAFSFENGNEVCLLSFSYPLSFVFFPPYIINTGICFGCSQPTWLGEEEVHQGDCDHS